MEPVTLIVAAIALGASEGARETTKQAIRDGYAAMKDWITHRYGSVTAEVEGLEHEPDEELRRALLAKKLEQAGAGKDVDLLDLAQVLLAAVEEQAPELPATIGVVIRRASVGGSITVEDVAVDGGTGVVTEDVETAGDLRISRVATRAHQEPPHPSIGAETATGRPASAPNFSSTQRNVIAGRDNNTYYSVGATETGNSGGRIRAVTASVKAVPFGEGLWTVMVNNASSGPITDLEVDVYAVDPDGNRLDGKCHPAKEKISLQELFRELLQGGMSGTLDAIGSQANSVYPAGMYGVPANLGSYGGVFADHIISAPGGLAPLLQNAQQQMVDHYPQVLSRDQSAEVLYSAPGAAEVRVDLQFADDINHLWRRRHGQQPEPVMVGD